jgi:hypothetical protein
VEIKLIDGASFLGYVAILMQRKMLRCWYTSVHDWREAFLFGQDCP